MIADASTVRSGAAALAAAVLVALLPLSLEAQGTPTRVMIRAVSHDAKIIGSSVGSARVTVTDVESGEVLARGLTEGETGDTERIMLDPWDRGEAVYDTRNAAGFMAEVELDRPTRVRIEAEGPLGTPHATQSASRTMLLVPGQHVLGNGVILELYGFTVELLEPDADPAEASGRVMPVRARVTMLCGCPTQPGGIWDSDDFTVEARIVAGDGVVLQKALLAFAGETNIYEGRISVPEGADDLKLQVLALDPNRANFGMVERSLE